jgi:hypothetical protein
MRKLIIIVLLHLMLLIPGYSLYGQEETTEGGKKIGQAGFKFMDVAIGARAAGMGGAFAFIGDDADAVFCNPAGIAQMDDKNFDLTVCKVDWIVETSVKALGLVANLGTFGNVGFSLLYTDYGEVIGTIYEPDSASGYVETGLLELGSYATGVSYARRLTDKFMIGANFRFAYEHLGDNLFTNDRETRDSIWTEKNEAQTIAYDIGTIFYPGFESLRLGMSIVNFSTAVRYEYEEGRTNPFQLPLTFKMGAAMDVLDLLGEHPDYSLLVDFELVHPRDYSQRYHLGGELSILQIIKLRAGYKFGYDEEGMAFGAGINTANVKLDYAYSEFGIFDFVNRVSLGLSF